MNKIYRLIWSRAKEKWVVVSEKVAAKGAIPSATVGALTLVALLATGGGAFALDPGALPGGGRITAGSGTISTSGSQMTINQSSQQMIANWDSFNIGQNAGVRFNQPNSGATALNRIQDQNPTQILGSLSANGRVFLLNPAGIIFGQSAKVDVGGLVASSLNMLDSDFLAGRYTLSGTGTAGSILNRGSISANGGIVALIAPKVTNEGTITAANGSAALIAGSRVSVDFTGDGLITYTVDQGAVDALAENKGLIRADGGLAVLTAKAADALTGAVVNNSGVIEARTLANKGGRILLLSDMQSGTTTVDGTLDAGAPTGGDGGFVETSGGRVEIGSGTVVTTQAPSGKSGTWLIDPDGFTIAASGGDIDGTTLGNNIDTNGDTVISSSDGSGSDGNINVNDNVTWHANTLTLTATNDININAVMTANDTASLDLEPGSGKVNVGFNPDGTFKGRVDFFQADGVTPRSGTGFLTINGNDYTVITDLGAAGDESTGAGTLQGMAYGGNSSGYFALGSNIDAATTSGWNYGEGLMPIGSSGYAFTGTFDGLGHTISNLTINRPASDNQGLFGVTDGATLRNVGLVNAGVTGSTNVGVLAGQAQNSTISSSYATGTVSGDYVGGLVGQNYGNGGGTASISNSHAAVDVHGNVSIAGGLVGFNYANGGTASIDNSYATGAVIADYAIGGLVGSNEAVNGGTASISSSFATGDVGDGNQNVVGGLVGQNYGNGNATASISNSYATGTVSGSSTVGGLVGRNYSNGYYGNATASISNSYATGAVGGSNYVGGLVGLNYGNGYYGNATASISNSYATRAVSGSSYVGGLVGQNYGYASGNGATANVSISNSYATGIVNGIDYVGGLVGQNYGYANGNGATVDANISNSYATGKVTGDSNYGANTGGLVGQNSVYAYGYGGGATANAVIDNSYATGMVSGSDNVGGLVGLNDGGSNYGNATASISNSYATGNVSGSGNNVGGLVGYDNGIGIINSFATGQVTGSGYAGGLVGGGSGSAVITSSFWDKTVNADPALDNGFGTGKTATELKTLATFTGAGWDIDDAGGTGATWRIYDGNTYPLLRAFLTPLTITASPVTKTYDGTAYPGDLNATYSDPTAPASGHLQGVTSPYASFVNAGSYTPSPYSDQLGYDITVSGDSSLTIAPAPLTITAGDVTKTYGQTLTLSAFTSSGLQNGETIGSVTLASAGTAATAGVGATPYAIAAGGATGGTFNPANYAITYNDGALTVTPTSLTITAADATKIYGQTLTLSAFTSSGLQNGETIGSVTLASAGTAATADVGATPYAIAAGSATGGTFNPANYAITYNSGALTVTPAPLTITAADATKTYGQTATFAGTEFTSSGLQNGEAIGSVTLASAGTAATAGVGATPYAIAAGSATSGTFNPANYAITYNSGALTVTPAPLTVTASDATKTYGQTVTFAGTEFTSSGLQNGETIGSVTLASAGAAASASAAGSPYAITASNASGGTFNAANYTITYNDGTLTVSAATAVSKVAEWPIQLRVPTPLAVSSQSAPPSIPQPPAPVVDYTGADGGTPITDDSGTTTGDSGASAGQ